MAGRIKKTLAIALTPLIYRMLKVILVDDDPVTHFILENTFIDEAVEFFAYDSAEDLLENVGYFKNSILLLDVNMPKVNGLELWKHLNENYDISECKTVVFTKVVDVQNAFKKINNNLYFADKHSVDMKLITDINDGIK